MARLDTLDVALLELMEEHCRPGILEISRRLGVARATVRVRLERLEAAGVITGTGAHIDLVAAGFPVRAFVTLEIAQGRLDDVAELLRGLPGVIEADATTGSGDVVCRLAAKSNEDLQSLLLELNRSDAIRRSTSVVILSEIVAPRAIPLLRQARLEPPRRKPNPARVTAEGGSGS